MVTFLAGNPVWNPAGWSNPDAVGWDHLMEVAASVIETMQQEFIQAGVVWLVFWLFFVVLALALAHWVFNRL